MLITNGASHVWMEGDRSVKKFCTAFICLFVCFDVVLFEQVIDWVKSFEKGIFVLWLGSSYPLVFIFKPETAEVSVSNQNQFQPGCVAINQLVNYM